MKIAWFTPFNIRSAIGQVGKEICEELSRYCEIDIWAAHDSEMIKTSVNVIEYIPSMVNSRQLSRYNHIVYNMGNNAAYHKPIWQVMEQVPGIVILHDQTMHGFFQQMMFISEFGGDPKQGYEKYKKLLKKYYGEIGIAAEELAHNETCKYFTNTEFVTKFSLLQPILDKATAVFTHAKFFADILKDSFLGPIGYSYLPCQLQQEGLDKNIPQVLHNRNDRVLIVSSGIVHPVKRTDKIIKVLRENPDLAFRVDFAIIGDCSGPFGEELIKLSQGTLKGCIHFLGYQPNNVMYSCLNRADICINLRYPNSEVCSYSLLEQMSFGKPVIVLKSGFFGEIPDNVVIKINLDDEEVEIEKSIRQLIADKSLRDTIGRNAKQFITEQCTIESYTERFLDFLKNVQETDDSVHLIRRTIEETNEVIRRFGFSFENVPWTIQDIVQLTQKVLLAQESEKDKHDHHVLGIWVGFNYAVPGLRREGIMRFLSSMVHSLMRNFPIFCEVWVYSFNEEEVKHTFSDIFLDAAFSGKFSIVTEKNWMHVLHVPTVEAALPRTINESKDNLNEIARIFSKAECFVPAVIYLDSVIGTDKPIFVPAHDMAVHTFYDDYIRKDPLYKFRILDIEARANHLARTGAFMFSNCETVRSQQLLKYIKSAYEKQISHVYLPTNIPHENKGKLLTEKETFIRFGIKGNYLFYATQIRPYKNIQILIKAFNILINNGVNIYLVLTGNISDVPEVETLIKDYQLEERVKSLQNVSENELYSLYNYAAAVPIPTLFEGGFPWQACEALYMDTPVIISDIPIVRERIESLGFEMENCGLEIFDPVNQEELAEKLAKMLSDREAIVEKQRSFKDKLLSYTWDDASKCYYEILFSNDKYDFN